jgi:hypothetical protein
MLEKKMYAGEEYGKAKQKEYLKPFMLVNKYVTGSLFYFKKRRDSFCDPIGTLSSIFCFRRYPHCIRNALTR